MFLFASFVDVFLREIIVHIWGHQNANFLTSQKNLMASSLLGRSWSQLISMNITNKHMKLTIFFGSYELLLVAGSVSGLKVVRHARILTTNEK